MQLIRNIPGPLLVFLGAFSLSFGGLIIKSFHGATQWQILFWRTVFFLLVVSVYLIITYKKNIFKSFYVSGIPGFFGGLILSFGFCGYVFAMYNTTVANTNFIIQTQTIFLAIFGYFFLKENISKTTLVSIILAISGIILMVGKTLSPGQMLGNIVAFIMPISFAVLILVVRNETGECQHVQVSMLEANIAFNWPDVMMHETVLDEDALHLPNLLGSYQLFSTSDGWVSVTAGTDSQWKAVCSALSRDDLANDERFSTAANRSKHFTEWYASFDEMLSAFTTAEAVQKCQAADVPAVRVLDPSEVAHDIHVKEVESIAEIEHPIVGKMRVPRQGAIFNNSSEHNPRPAPSYCQDTTELLIEIGYSNDAIEKLKSSGTIS